jgi:hypothetical protein
MSKSTNYISAKELLLDDKGSLSQFSFLGIRINNSIDKAFMYWLNGFLSEIETIPIPNTFYNADSSFNYKKEIEINITKLESLSFEYHRIYWNKKIFGILPPGTEWISSSGRFAAVGIHQFVDNQCYVLWDLIMKKAMPLVFQDLEGIDENEQLVYCRTNGEYHNQGGRDAPMKINTEMCWDANDWDNTLMPKEYPALSETDKKLIINLWDYDDKHGTTLSNSNLFHYLTGKEIPDW